MRIIWMILFLMPTLLMAQQSGKITYETTIDVHRRMMGHRAQFKDMVPQFRKTQSELYFHKGQSLYKHLPPSEDELAERATQGRRMRFAFRNAENTVWIDYENHARIESREFMDKKFLIKGEPEKYPWKLTGETKQVGEYLCQKATFQDTSDQVVAWFTINVPVPLGPGRYGQLPGLILHIDINDGERTMTAQEIKLDGDLDFSIIKEPKKGKEVTQEEFREIVAEKMKEMGAEGGRGVFMRTHRGH